VTLINPEVDSSFVGYDDTYKKPYLHLQTIIYLLQKEACFNDSYFLNFISLQDYENTVMP